MFKWGGEAKPLKRGDCRRVFLGDSQVKGAQSVVQSLRIESLPTYRQCVAMTRLAGKLLFWPWCRVGIPDLDVLWTMWG